MRKNVVYHQDCLTGMKVIPNSSVDMILTDPPYCLQKAQSLHFKKKGTIVKKFDFDAFRSQADYLAFMRNVIKELSRVLKEGGGGFLFCSESFVSYLTEIIREEGLKCRSIFYWHKTNCFPAMKKRKMFAGSVELAIHFSKGVLEVWNPPNNINHNHLDCPIANGKDRTLFRHPTQKPLRLIKYLMRICTNQDDVVLDPFMGSGTTAIAALQTERQFIGFENNATYCQTIRERFKDFLINNVIEIKDVPLVSMKTEFLDIRKAA